VSQIKVQDSGHHASRGALRSGRFDAAPYATRTPTGSHDIGRRAPSRRPNDIRRRSAGSSPPGEGARTGVIYGTETGRPSSQADRVTDRETGVRHALDDAQYTVVRVNT
jgi:hypothetical protein